MLEMASGDVLACYSSLDAIRSVLLDCLNDDPESENELAVAIVDDHGNAITALPAVDFLAAT
jgi:arylsulfatase A-like enzyme